MFFFAPGQVLDEGDHPRRVFDGVQTLRRQRRVGGAAVHLAAVDAATLVGCDHLHVSGFAHHATVRLDAGNGQFVQQHRDTQAAHLFVVAQRNVNGGAQRRCGELGRMAQHHANKAFHVAGTATVQPAVAYLRLEGV